MPQQISVIIPAHNEEKYLEKTLQSLRQQNFLDYETIIVCNGCTDQTVEIAQKYLNRNTKIIPQNIADVSLARNIGAKEASGEILLFLDADTELEPSSLKTVVEEYNDKTAVATTKTQPNIHKLKYKTITNLKNWYNQSSLYQGCSGVLICRKKDFHSVGGYPVGIKVKEHRKLILKLKQLGEYQVIKTNAITSMRRFEQWGIAKTSLFWAKQWAKNYLSDLKKSSYETIR